MRPLKSMKRKKLSAEKMPTEINETEELSAKKMATFPRARILKETSIKIEEDLSAKKMPVEINEAEGLSDEKMTSPRAKILKESSTKVEEDFDWDAFEGTKATSTTASKKEMMYLYDNTLSILQEKEVVDGKVISMNKREVVVDIGYKSTELYL